MKENINEVKELLADYCGIEAVELDRLNDELASLPESAGIDFINYISCLLSLDTLELCPTGMAHDLSLLYDSEIFAQMLSEGNLYASYLLLSVINTAITNDLSKKDDKYYQDILGRVGFIDASIQNSMNKLNSGMYLLVENLVYLIEGVALERYKRLPAARVMLNKAKVGIERFRLIECVDPLTLTLMYGVPCAVKGDIEKFCDAAVKQIEASVSIIDDGSAIKVVAVAAPTKPEEKDGMDDASTVFSGDLTVVHSIEEDQALPGDDVKGEVVEERKEEHSLNPKIEGDMMCAGSYPTPIRASGQLTGTPAPSADPRTMMCAGSFPPPAFPLRTLGPLTGTPVPSATSLDGRSIGYLDDFRSADSPGGSTVGYLSAAQSPEGLSASLETSRIGGSSAFSRVVRRPLFSAAAARSVEASVSTPRPGV